MQIELFMSNFSHDRAEPSHIAMPAGWLHGGMKKPADLSSLADAVGADHGGSLIPKLHLRQEQWGGLVFNKDTHAIFEVDSAAFSIFERLKNGESVDTIRLSKQIPDSELDQFVAHAKKHSLLG